MHLVSCVKRNTSAAMAIEEPNTTMGRSGWPCDPRATTKGATVVPICDAQEMVQFFSCTFIFFLLSSTLLRLSRSAKVAFLASVEKSSGVKESTRKKAAMISACLNKYVGKCKTGKSTGVVPFLDLCDDEEKRPWQ